MRLFLELSCCSSDPDFGNTILQSMAPWHMDTTHWESLVGSRCGRGSRWSSLLPKARPSRIFSAAVNLCPRYRRAKKRIQISGREARADPHTESRTDLVAGCSSSHSVPLKVIYILYCSHSPHPFPLCCKGVCFYSVLGSWTFTFLFSSWAYNKFLGLSPLICLLVYFRLIADSQ